MNTRTTHATGLDFERVAEMRPRKNGETRAFLGALQRQMFLIIGIFVVFSAIAFAIVWLIPGRYESDATVLVQPAGSLADPSSSIGQAQPEIVRSQLEVVESQSVISHVVDDLNLMTDPEFEATGAASRGDENTKRAAIISNVAKRLKVDNDGRSVTIHISFQANSPQKAARIVDAIANEYIRAESALKNGAFKATEGRFDLRLADLRVQALRAEQVADNYRRSAGLVWLSPSFDDSDAVGGSTYVSKLLSEFSRQAADMTAAVAQADSKAQQASADMASTGGASTPEVLSSTLISTLLQKDSDLANTESSLESHYTAENPLVVQVRAQRAALAHALDAARHNIERSIKMQAQSAEQADHAAGARANALEGAVSQQIAKSVLYRQLQREAVIKRKIYEDFADQSGTISERSLLQLPDAVLVSPASLPIKEGWPNRPLLFIMGCMVAFILGCAAALSRELRRVGRHENAKRMLREEAQL